MPELYNRNIQFNHFAAKGSFGQALTTSLKSDVNEMT